MHFHHAVAKVLFQLGDTMQQLTPQQYIQPCANLFNASIGQHVRHTIELFIELDKGYPEGVVNYDKRKRDLRIETDISFAYDTLVHQLNLLNKPDKPLKLELDFGESNPENLSVESNYYRELLYNLEHAVHHMALIRVGVNEVAAIQLPENFGIAISTIKHRNTCAQ